MKQVVLITVTEHDSHRLADMGMYPNLPTALQGLGSVGIHPGFSEGFPMFNKDGTQAGHLWVGDRYLATVAVMPYDIAAALINTEQMLNVPDYVDEMEDM